GEGQLDPDTKPLDLQEKSEPNLSPQGILGTRLLMDDSPMETHTHDHNDFSHAHASVVHNSVDNLGDYHMPLDPQMIDINTHLPRFQHHDAMVDPYSHDAHALHHSNFDDEVRQHTANDYQIMVDDTTEADGGTTLRPETLGLVNAQPHDLQVEPEILNKYPYDTRPEDDLDFT
ncbi:Protein spt10, partial [Elasticomyces elasticus]